MVCYIQWMPLPNKKLGYPFLTNDEYVHVYVDMALWLSPPNNYSEICGMFTSQN